MEPTTNSFMRFLTWPIILVGLLIIVAVWLGVAYNGFVKSNEAIDAQWAQVESQYQRRFDLIPNLVNSVKGAMTQEQTVFNDIAEARTRYSGATTPEAQAQAATQVESALGRLLVVMENYPQLKSIDTVQSLMAELSGTENRIAVERMRYNELVRDYNVRVKSFPGTLFASMFGFAPRTMFEAATGADQAPTVNL
jgi:LemA protein